MGRNFRKIEAWVLADELVILIYKFTAKFPKEETYGLTSQMKRSAISVASNIAEGCGRRSKKDYLRFLYIALASLSEIEYYIHLGEKLGYLNNKDCEILETKRRHAAGKLFRLIELIEDEIKKFQVNC